MPTVKSQIITNVPTTLTTAYTNSTAGGATLKAVNTFGQADPTAWTVTNSPAGNDDFTFFGSSTPTFADSPSQTGAWGTPLSIRLAADRLLLIWMPHNRHVGGGQDTLTGNVLHSQIVRWNGSTYQSGPIININLPTTVYSSATSSIWQQPNNMSTVVARSNFTGVAITSTKVALAYRFGSAFRLLKLNIVGNAVDGSSVVNFDLTGATAFNTTTANAYELSVIPGDADKVLVGASGATNWSLQTFNMPDSGAITVASTLFSTGLTAVATGCFSIAPLTKNALSGVSTFVLAANTATATISIQNFALTLATNAFAASGTAVTLSVTQAHGIEAVSLSTGDTPDAVIAYVNSAAYNVMRFVRQANVSQATNTETTLTLSHSSARSIKGAFNLGDQKAAFFGDANTAVIFSSTGTATDLIPSTLSTNTTSHLTQFFPFDSRPLFSAYDTNSVIVNRVSQLFSMTGGTATTAGTLTFTGNYLPWGHNYGGHYAWSEQAQCWMVGFGGRIYALSTAGVVIAEVSLYQLSTSLNYLASIKQLAVTPAGKIIGITDQFGANPSWYYGQTWYTAGNYSPFAFATTAVTVPTDITRTRPLNVTTVTSGYNIAIDMAVEANTERAFAIYGTYNQGSPSLAIGALLFNGSTWSVIGNNTSLSNTAQASYQYGSRPNVRLIQDSPDGTLWRLVGSRLSSATEMAYQYITTSVFAIDSAWTSFSWNTSINPSTQSTYAITTHTTNNSTVLAFYDPTAAIASLRAFFSFGGRLITPVPLSWRPADSTGATGQFVNALVTKYGASVVACSTNGLSTNTPTVFTFDSITPGITTKYTNVATTGHGWITLHQNNQSGWNLFGPGINVAYAAPGPDTARFTVAVSGGGTDFEVTPYGGALVATGSAYRTNDTYVIPAGYTVKLRSSLAGSLNCLLTIVEEV
jgi:hypothetical protein